MTWFSSHHDEDKRQRVLDTARRVLMTAALAVPFTVMPAGAPAVAQGGNQVRSTVAKDPANPAQGASVFSPTIAFVDRAKFTPSHGLMSHTGFPGWVDRGTTPTVSVGRSNGYGYRSYMTTDVFDVSVEATAGGVHRLTVFCDGQRIAPSDVSVSANGWVIYVKFTFPSWGRRLVEIYFTNSSNIRGINLPVGASIEAAPQPELIRSLFLADSYGEISGSDWNLGVLPHKLAEGLGQRGLITSPSSGTGYLTDAPAKNGFMRRHDLARVGRVDYAWVWLGLNDRNADPAAVEAYAAGLISHAMFTQPDAIIHVFLPFSTVAYVTPPAVEQAVVNAIRRVGDERVIYSKTSHLITPVNAAQYMGPDNLHLVQAGHNYVADYGRAATVAGMQQLLMAA